MNIDKDVSRLAAEGTVETAIAGRVWVKPEVEEIAVALEINDYCSAELDRRA